MTGSLHPDGGGQGAGTSAPAAVPGSAPEVVDFDLLDVPGVAPGPTVVDFGALADPPPAGSGAAAHVRSGSEQSDIASTGVPAHEAPADVLDEPLAATAVEVAVLDESAPTSVPVAVVDVDSAGRPARRSAARRDAGRTPAEDPDTGRPEDGPRRSSFGDDGSSPFGGRSRSSASRRGGGRRGPRREWGIQLDAEVDEPSRSTPEGTPVADGDPAGPAVHDRPRPGGRGRAGSFGRPRRAAGEPAPEYEDPEQAARQICLTALTGASRTRQQLADLLSARDIPADAAESVLERFTEVGLIDDAAFAAAWVGSRQAGRGLSRRALADELRRKGVDKEVASVALEAVDPQDEWDTARALVARKVPGMRRLDHATATRRLIGQLTRKGYSAGLAAWVVREALEADGKAEDAAAEADDAPPVIQVRDASDEGPDGAPVRRGLWSGRPLDEVTEPAAEVGEGLGMDGWARTRSARQRPR